MKSEATRRPRRARGSGVARSIPAHPGTDFKVLYRKLEDALSQIEKIDDVSRMLERILESLLERFQDELGFTGGRIYQRKGDDFHLCCGFGDSREAPVGIRVPPGYLPHQRTLESGLLIMRRDEPGIDEEFEETIGVSSHFAAMAVGEGNSHVIAFSIKGQVREEQILYSLTALRHVVNLKLEQRKVTGMLEESRAVQEGILPAGPPAFEGYDVDGRSKTAEIVGGDLYDYLPLPGDRLGVAIADSSGHGLPAALLARDVITGLRMAAGESLGIVEIVERLNRLIHRASPAAKFVSLFYGELHRDGAFTYCNAGHNPPLLLRGGSFLELDRGGTVLGPIPGASFESASERLEPGDALILYTDGVVERQDRAGEEFGTERLRRLLLDLGGASAREMVEAILSAVEVHGQGLPALDDVTVVAVRRSRPGRAGAHLPSSHDSQPGPGTAGRPAPMREAS